MWMNGAIWGSRVLVYHYLFFFHLYNKSIIFLFLILYGCGAVQWSGGNCLTYYQIQLNPNFCNMFVQTSDKLICRGRLSWENSSASPLFFTTTILFAVVPCGSQMVNTDLPFSVCLLRQPPCYIGPLSCVNLSTATIVESSHYRCSCSPASSLTPMVDLC